jgi:hypothetical protein
MGRIERSGRFPQLHRVALRVDEAGEPAVGVRLVVHLDRDAHVAQLRHHRVEVVDPEVHAPGVGAESRALPVLSTERREHRRAALLVPRVVFGGLGWEPDAEVLGVPLRERLGIVGAEEEASDPGDALHDRNCAARVGRVPGA